jgi:hypothetical protein
MEKVGFNEIWCSWIRRVMEMETVVVKLNNTVSDQDGSICPTKSSLLFNLAADVLTRMVASAQQNLLVTGMAEILVDKGVAILQYADDTVMCLKDNMEKARNVKLMLYLFEQMSGLKINFKNSETILIGGDNNLTTQYVDLFNC